MSFRHDTVLHSVFGCGFLPKFTSEELMRMVYQMNPDALHKTNGVQETPFHLAVRYDNKLAIELVQWSLSLDQIREAFAKYNRKCPQHVLDQLHEWLLDEPLSRDVVGTVCEYLGIGRGKRTNKRTRDEDSENEDTPSDVQNTKARRETEPTFD